MFFRFPIISILRKYGNQKKRKITRNTRFLLVFVSLPFYHIIFYLLYYNNESYYGYKININNYLRDFSEIFLAISEIFLAIFSISRIVNSGTKFVVFLLYLVRK